MSTRKGLTGVSILITTFGEAAPKITTPYKLALRESNSGKTVREAAIEPSRFADWKWVEIFFEPIKNSKDKEYIFTLVPATETVETPVGISLTPRRIYPEGRSVVRRKITDRTVVFKLIFKADE